MLVVVLPFSDRFWAEGFCDMRQRSWQDGQAHAFEDFGGVPRLLAGRLADLTIITSDNPRNEDPQAIIDDIKTGISRTDGKYVEIIDRKEAIRYAIEHGEPGDIIICAGKGHETYQEINGVKHDMDERVLIKEVLKELKENK